MLISRLPSANPHAYVDLNFYKAIRDPPAASCLVLLMVTLPNKCSVSLTAEYDIKQPVCPLAKLNLTEHIHKTSTVSDTHRDYSTTLHLTVDFHRLLQITE